MRHCRGRTVSRRLCGSHYGTNEFDQCRTGTPWAECLIMRHRENLQDGS